MTNLVEITNGDVRSCLNTLQVSRPLLVASLYALTDTYEQFIKSKSATVTDEAIRSSSVGLKDSGSSLQSIWNNLLIPTSAKQRRKQSAIDDGRYVARLTHEISSNGEFDKIFNGLFENYPNLKPLDTSLRNICLLHDRWTGYFDRLSAKVSEGMEWELMGYMSYALVPWYSHMAAPANNARPIEWPKADYEVSGNLDLDTSHFADVSISPLTSNSLSEVVPNEDNQ